MKLFIIGADGNIGGRLTKVMQSRGHEVIGTAIGDLDMTQRNDLLSRFKEVQPELVINCAGLTNVDLCAQQPAEALRINGIGNKYLALACQKIGAAICYISTNEVFDGTQGTPYQEYDVPRPINPYGYSKW